MRSQNLKRLQDFVGTICTILTSSTCKNNFTDSQFPDFFLGIIESVDEDGVFSRHPITKCMNFYSWNHVVGIFQEQVIQEKDPQYKEIVQELKNKPPENGSFVPVNMDESPFLNPEVMADLAKQASEIQKKMIQKNT